MNPTTDRQEFESSFWDSEVDRNIYHSIWAHETVQDGVTPDVEAFSKSGNEEAVRLFEYTHPDTTVLDLGCGIGRILRGLAPRCKWVFGVDISAKMIQSARSYLDGIDGITLIQGDGANLPGVKDGEIDFLYSLLCLIHVNKRSAYRYLLETKRVLRSGGRALLQFQNILSPDGLLRFQEVVGGDFPFEFYTPEELHFLLESVGLEVLTESKDNEFINLCVINGSTEEWIQDQVSSLSLSDLKISRRVPEGDCNAGAATEIDVALSNNSLTWRVYTLLIQIVVEVNGNPTLVAHGRSAAALAPRTSSLVRMTFADASKDMKIELDGKALPMSLLRAQMPDSYGSADLHCAILPSGFPSSDETRVRFADWSQIVRITD